MLKWVSELEGAEILKTGVFLICPLVVVPGFIVQSLGTILAPFWVSLGSFLLSFEVPGHHFGTLGPHQNDAQGVQNSMKMNPQTNLAGFIFLEF